MIGLDTNVVVRYLVQDDAVQSALATSAVASLSARSPGYVSTVVFVEAFWVLQRAYKVPTRDVATTLLALVSTDEIVTDQESAVRSALRRASEGYDFADALISQDGIRRGSAYTLTFDRRASELEGMRLLEGDQGPAAP